MDCERSQSAIDIVLATFLLNLDCCLLYLHGIISGSSYTTVGCSACDCWIIILDVGVQTSWNTAFFSEKGGVRINRVFELLESLQYAVCLFVFTCMLGEYNIPFVYPACTILQNVKQNPVFSVECRRMEGAGNDHAKEISHGLARTGTSLCAPDTQGLSYGLLASSAPNIVLVANAVGLSLSSGHNCLGPPRARVYNPHCHGDLTFVVCTTTKWMRFLTGDDD